MPIWRPYTPHYAGAPPVPKIVRAQGSYLYAEDGRAFWDGVCAWWVTIHGHSHPFIAEAIAKQAKTLDQVLFADFTHPAAEILTEKLTRLTGLTWAFFSDDGSTAVEVALKVAIQYFYNRGEKRHRILALEGAYHGDTFGAMSVSARSTFTAPYKDYLFEVEWLPFPSPENEAALRSVLESLRGRRDIAAFIGEPLLQGTAGMRMYAAHFWDDIARAVRAAGALIIADEVFTGFGRTGTLFAIQQCEEKPDILCLAKGLTGGFLPMGLTLVREEVFSAFFSPEREKVLYHGHSYTGNPIASAAAVANLTLWEHPQTQEQLQMLVRYQRQLAEQWNAIHPTAPARQLGLVLAIDLPSTEKGYFAAHRTRLKAYALERGVFLRPLGSVAYILPALSSQPSELERAVSLIDKYLQALPEEERS
ncbi:MAG: adenosylmethionine--8-amino-7-oxononanoate transaminase [Bacteroidia bacterium]|nr:adenosylmethionine--8-amino-7-oxononanoate transaminase [Bacteroidia bacterium]MDW8014451.1 adenosylmethionine--8-amino-7-oxononanoate transaminase [Bacteroidia bacterium]